MLDPADVPAFNAPEPLFSALQLVGAAPFPARPSVAGGIFGAPHGSRLAIVAFAQDGIIRPAEAEALFDHLTAGSAGRTFQVIHGESAVHDLHISDPAGLAAELRIH